MKNTIILLFFFLLTFCAHGQKKTDGWEFLTWGLDSAAVQEQVKKNESQLKTAYALEADFNYQDLNTWLHYDKNKKLNKVVQRATFSVNQQEAAQKAYEKVRRHLISTYGPLSSEHRDTSNKVIELKWELKNTRIALEYDYQYKVIDELGAGSYWIDVVFEAK